MTKMITVVQRQHVKKKKFLLKYLLFLACICLNLVEFSTICSKKKKKILRYSSNIHKDRPFRVYLPQRGIFKTASNVLITIPGFGMVESFLWKQNWMGFSVSLVAGLSLMTYIHSYWFLHLSINQLFYNWICKYFLAWYSAFGDGIVVSLESCSPEQKRKSESTVVIMWIPHVWLSCVLVSL